MPSAGARAAAHSCSWSAGRPLAWVSTCGTGSPAGGGTPSGIGRAQLPRTAGRHEQRRRADHGDSPQPTHWRHRTPSNPLRVGAHRPTRSEVSAPAWRNAVPCRSGADKVSHTLLWQAKAWYAIRCSEDKSMTAVADLPVSIQAAAPSVTSQLFGSGLIGLREGLEAAHRGHDPGRLPGQVGPPRRAQMGVAGRRRSDRHDGRRLPRDPVRREHHHRPGAPRPSPASRRWSPSRSSRRWCSG